MRLLFVHDHPFFDEHGIVYSGGSFPQSTWQKYLDNFEQITVYGRNSLNQKDKGVISSVDRVKFVLTSSYNSSFDILKNRNKISNELVELIKEADIVLIRLPSVLGIIAGRLSLKSNKLIWVEQVGNAKEALNSHGSTKGKIIAPIFDFLNRKLTHKAHFVSYVTEKKLQLDYPSNENAIVTSLSNVIINTILEKQELLDSRFFEPKLKIGLIGGFEVKYKGQDVLLKAIDILPQEVKSNIELYFIGKGQHKWLDDLAEKLNLKESIKFIGALEHGEQINLMLKSLSLYIQPSLTEGMPRASIEAMSMGCPIIGSNVGEIPDIVNSKFIHNRGDFKALASHILFLFKNREILKSEAGNSLRKAIPYQFEKLRDRRNLFYKKMNSYVKK